MTDKQCTPCNRCGDWSLKGARSADRSRRPFTGLRQIIVAARSGEGEDKQTLLFGVATAYTLIMPAGVQIKIDDREPISLQYDLCFPTSCQGELELTKDMFEKMRKGKLMVVTAMNMQQKALAFPVPLTDFGKTFDGPPADNAKYEEAQRQWSSQCHLRQTCPAPHTAHLRMLRRAAVVTQRPLR